jgi:hypothetical protein
MFYTSMFLNLWDASQSWDLATGDTLWEVSKIRQLITDVYKYKNTLLGKIEALCVQWRDYAFWENALWDARWKRWESLLCLINYRLVQ